MTWSRQGVAKSQRRGAILAAPGLLFPLLPFLLASASAHARFLSPGADGHDSSLSLYDFANGDPVNSFDPDGRFGKQVQSVSRDAIYRLKVTVTFYHLLHGDDENLDSSTYAWWPKDWELPIPNNGPHPIESEAINASDHAHNENQSARSDWANPGKNHKTVDLWDD